MLCDLRSTTCCPKKNCPKCVLYACDFRFGWEEDIPLNSFSTMNFQTHFSTFITSNRIFHISNGAREINQEPIPSTEIIAFQAKMCSLFALSLKLSSSPIAMKVFPICVICSSSCNRIVYEWENFSNYQVFLDFMLAGNRSIHQQLWMKVVNR